jgi:hypothetical protein
LVCTAGPSGAAGQKTGGTQGSGPVILQIALSFSKHFSAEDAMLPRRTTRNPAVLSYYTMRRAVGVIALTLPFALASGVILSSLFGPAHRLPHPLLQRSISDYYYTPMRDYLVGSLCAIASFLACSRGYNVHDEITGYMAGAFTFGVAFFPSFDPYSARYSRLDVEFGYLHTVCAALMFFVIAYFCIFLFRRSSPEKPFTRRKLHRNRVYAVCGLVMVACIVLLVTLTFSAIAERRPPSHLVFWCESAALGAFGVAWLTKGEGILRDKPHNHNPSHAPVEVHPPPVTAP